MGLINCRAYDTIGIFAPLRPGSWPAVRCSPTGPEGIVELQRRVGAGVGIPAPFGACCEVWQGRFVDSCSHRRRGTDPVHGAGAPPGIGPATARQHGPVGAVPPHIDDEMPLGPSPDNAMGREAETALPAVDPFDVYLGRTG